MAWFSCLARCPCGAFSLRNTTPQKLPESQLLTISVQSTKEFSLGSKWARTLLGTQLAEEALLGHTRLTVLTLFVQVFMHCEMLGQNTQETIKDFMRCIQGWWARLSEVRRADRAGLSEIWRADRAGLFEVQRADRTCTLCDFLTQGVTWPWKQCLILELYWKNS